MGTLTTVDDLVPGDHACLTFSDEEERLDIVAAFVRDGLAGGERVLCYTATYQPAVLAGQLADRGLAARAALDSGQLAIEQVGRVWLADGGFRATDALDGLSGRIDRAREDGFGALRVAADMGWAAQPVTGVDQLLSFEKQVSQLLSDSAALAVCQYDRQLFDPVTLASTTATHSHAVAATVYHEDPVLRICRQHTPAGLRLAGELDYSYLTVLTQALGEAVRLDGDVQLNLTALRFIDAAAAGTLVQAAATLPGTRRMTIRCPRLVGTVLRHAGAPGVDQLRVVVTRGEH